MQSPVVQKPINTRGIIKTNSLFFFLTTYTNFFVTDDDLFVQDAHNNKWGDAPKMHFCFLRLSDSSS